MTYKKAILKIESLAKAGSKPGLERIKKLMKIACNPQKSLKFIHVAGTNAKGSVSFLTASILKESGLKTGLYISPSIMDFRERIQINGKMISKKKLSELVSFFEPILERREFSSDAVTEFEFTCAAAFKFFSDEKCDAVVLETGMGGRLDATNIIKKPLCSVITSVSLDHTKVLGATVEEIAKEKFGIIKPGCPVILGSDIDNSVYKIAVKAAQKSESPLFTARAQEIKNIKYSLTEGTSFNYRNLKLNTPILGKHQIKNIATAFKIIDTIGKKLKVSEKAIKNGLKKVYIPCRFEVVNRSPLIILDAAHNPAGVESLVCAARTYLSEKKLIGIIGMFSDKDTNAIISKSAPIFKKIFTVEPKSDRAFSLCEITAAVKQHHPNVLPCVSISDAIKLAASESDERSCVLIFGSFSIMKEAKNFVKVFFTD